MQDPVRQLIPLPPTHLVIASRESRLALWQAEHIRARLMCCYPGCQVDILGMTTRGDRILDKPLAQIGGKGLFIKELELALQEGRADLAVHSLKDVPMEMPAGFAVAAIAGREEPCDALVSNRYAALDELTAGAVVGTSSLRREAILRSRYPHLEIASLRGNLDTRLRKLDEGQFDAIILASAGLLRLGLAERIRQRLPFETFLPAPGQGALAIETVDNRPELLAWLSVLDDPATHACVVAERAFSRALGGSCRVPLGALATIGPVADRQTATLHLQGFVATPDGRQVLRGERSGPGDSAEALGEGLAQSLIARGAASILRGVADGAMRQPLAGRRILVTRPLAQAGPLVTAIEQQGGQGVVFPLIDIAPADDLVPLAKALGHFCTFDFAVFISANAVDYSVPHLLAWADWPATVRAVAVGPGTAARLAAHRVRDVLVPSAGFDSEAVLALPELAPERANGRNILLLRGNGGRPLLADALRERGAQVTCVSCYQRRTPVDASPLLNLLSGDGGDVLDAVTLSSSEGVRNLLALLTPSALECLRRLPCFVPHRRIAEVVAEAGLRAILTEPADQGIIDGLCRYGWPDPSEQSLNLSSKEKA